MNDFEILKEIDFIFSEKPHISTNLHSQNHDAIKEKISQNTPIDRDVDKKTKKHIKELIRQSVLDYLDNNKSEKFVYRHYVFSMLSDQFRDCFFLPFESIEWKELLPIIKESYCLTYEINEVGDDVLFKLHKTLRNENLKPYKITTENGHVVHDDVKYIKLSKKIDSLVKELGGKNVLDNLLSYMNGKKYNSDCKRYMFPSGTHQYGQELHLFTPISYLFNLSLKHINSVGNFNIDRWKYLISLSQDFLFLYDLQDFHNIETIFFPNMFQKDFLYRHVMFDNIFRLRQVTWNKFSFILEKLLETTPEKNEVFYNDFGFSLTDYISLIKKIYDNPRIENLTSTELHKEAFTKKENDILKLCSSLKNANPCYLCPTDFDKLTINSKPLVFNKDKYFLVNKSFSGWGFYNVISDLNRNQKYIDIGKNIEELLKTEIRNVNNCTLFSGKYSNSHKLNGECDIVYKDNDYIIFIETKKKTITVNSLMGKNLTDLLFDLSSMIITSQSQAILHEYSIRTDNLISFEDGTRLIYENQKIYKVSLTLFDLYMFNDHYFSMQLIEYLRTVDFHFLDEDKMSKAQRNEAISHTNIDGINKKNKKLTQYVNELEKLGVSTQENSFYSYFVSLEQLLFLITEAKNKNCSLGLFFDDMKNCSFRTGDFYSEFYELQKIRNS